MKRLLSIGTALLLLSPSACKKEDDPKTGCLFYRLGYGCTAGSLIQ